MIYVIDGPDGAGKTVLSKKLVADFELEYHHEGPPQTDDLRGHYCRLISDAYLKKRDVVFDRMALSEMVYGPILRDGCKLGKGGWRYFMSVMKNVGAQHIICLPPPEFCYKAWSNNFNAELFTGRITFYQTYSQFAYLANKLQLLTYDYSTQAYAPFFRRLHESKQ